MAEIMVFAERDDLAFELLSRGGDLAGQFNMGLSVALPGPASQPEAYFARGVQKVYVSKADWGQDPATWAQALSQIITAHDVQIILVSSTRRGKAMASGLAQRLGAGCVTDVFGIEASGTDLAVSRYGLGGMTVVSEEILTPLKVIAVLPRSFAAAGEQAGLKGEVVEVAVRLDQPRVKVIERQPKVRESVELEKAEVLVCVGRGRRR